MVLGLIIIYIFAHMSKYVYAFVFSMNVIFVEVESDITYVCYFYSHFM